MQISEATNIRRGGICTGETNGIKEWLEHPLRGNVITREHDI